LLMRIGLREKFFVGMFGIVALLGVAIIVAVKTTVRDKLVVTLQQRGVVQRAEYCRQCRVSGADGTIFPARTDAA